MASLWHIGKYSVPHEVQLTACDVGWTMSVLSSVPRGVNVTAPRGSVRVTLVGPGRRVTSLLALVTAPGVVCAIRTWEGVSVTQATEVRCPLSVCCQYY